jgi:hypothetical protein
MVGAFKKHGMTPPMAILLANRDDAYAIIMACRQENNMFINPENMNTSNVVEFDGKACGTMEICGVKFYWPLQRIARREGGFIYG